jgi:hypothetical protein
MESANTRWAKVTPTRIALGAGALALLLGLFQLTLPHVLTGVLGTNLGYDDGAYVGAAVAFAHGAWPYRDFVFVQPPGIVYILSPIGLLSHITGTREVLIIARILTVLVTAANATLAGLLLRRQGRIGVALGAFAVALWPTAVAVDRTVELEPYLVFAVLIGALVLFKKKRPSDRRMAIAGVIFGFAVVIKVWAVFPILVVMACLWLCKRRVLPLIGGLLAGGVVLSLPFFIAAPGNFWREVIWTQLARKGIESAPSTSLGLRALMILGLRGLWWFSPSEWLAFAVLIVLIGTVVYTVIRHRGELRPFEWFVIGTPFLIVASTFDTPYLYDHYAYFPAIFIALMLGVVMPRIIADVTRANPVLRIERESGAVRGHVVLVGAVLIAASGWLVASTLFYESAYLSEAWNPATMIDAVTLPGSCVLSDYPSDLLVANRFISADPHCPIVVDPYGMFLVYNNGIAPNPIGPYGEALMSRWRHYLNTADYIDMRITTSDYLPWSPSSVNWFNLHYSLVGRAGTFYPNSLVDMNSRSFIYERRNNGLPG